MNHPRGGGQKRDRSGWGSYYAHKRQQNKDRRGRFPQDSSDAMAINAGVQPTLARRRRQLAEDKWEARHPHSETDRIADDLRAIHTQQQKSSGSRNPHNRVIANNMVMNARYRFWKRKLSHLSTQDFEEIWRTGQAKFKQQIAPQPPQQEGAEASTVARTTSAPTSGANHGPTPSTNTTTRSSANGTVSLSRTGNGNRPRANSVGRGQPSSSLSLSATRPSPPTALASALSAPHQEVIDLCDSDSDSDDEAGDQTHTSNRSTNAGSPTNNAPNHKTTGPIGNEHDKNHTRASATNVPNNDTKNNGSIPKEKNTKDASEKKQPCESSPKPSSSTAPANSSPSFVAVTESPATTTTATNPKTVMESSRNRWSKLFLGPDFRMDNVFSLEDAGL